MMFVLAFRNNSSYQEIKDGIQWNREAYVEDPLHYNSLAGIFVVVVNGVVTKVYHVGS